MLCIIAKNGEGEWDLSHRENNKANEGIDPLS